MKDSAHEATRLHLGLYGQSPAVQVICLASGGGPSEDNVTGFLVRSIGSDWAKGSLLAVDAGSHLAPITRILEQSFPSVSGLAKGIGSNENGNSSRRPSSPSPSPTSPVGPPPQLEPVVLPSGPFAGLRLPNESARANALHIIRTYVSSYLITHPHLDHLSGFAINTAAFHATSRPKTLAALPSTVNAIKDHIFNDVIWPNLTDEDGGVGFVTFQRLKEGGDLMLGEGEGRGYIDVCDGLGAKAFKISHGTCTKSPPSHKHRGSLAGMSELQPIYSGSIQGISQDHASTNARRSMSISQHQATPGTPRSSLNMHNHPSPQIAASMEPTCVVDSTAFFLRDEHTQREILMFGDVEPDSLSLSPRNALVWEEAARKIAHGVLGGIFIECSYDDSQPDALLFGHLSPRHLIAELQSLGGFVLDAKSSLEAEKAQKKRKRSGANGLDNFARNVLMEPERKRRRSLASRLITADERRRSSASNQNISGVQSGAMTPPMGENISQDGFYASDITRGTDSATSPKSMALPPPFGTYGGNPATEYSLAGNDMPLHGIKIIIIHIKDTLKDGPHVSENILAELRDYDAQLQQEGHGLGCEFIISRSGESYWF